MFLRLEITYSLGDLQSRVRCPIMHWFGARSWNVVKLHIFGRSATPGFDVLTVI